MNTLSIEHARQSGMALVVGLLMLVIMTLIGTASLRSAMLEERMTSNAEAIAVVKEAAEATLRAGEATVVGAFLPIFNGNGGYHPLPVLGAPPRWSTVDWADDSQTQSFSAFNSGPGRLGDLDARFIVEQYALGVSFEPKNKGQEKKGVGTLTVNNFYQITARVSGADGRPVVMLQTIYAVTLTDSKRQSWRQLR